jgi:N-acetylglucosaminyldiphosphoundecaprenol N-acetyl-beta-D-mannosaminyltransferase
MSPRSESAKIAENCSPVYSQSGAFLRLTGESLKIVIKYSKCKSKDVEKYKEIKGYTLMEAWLLGARIDALTMEETVERVSGFIKSGRPHRILTLNPEYLYRAQFDGGMMRLITRSDLVTPDGVGIVWACRVAGYPVKERITGIDLMQRLVKRAAACGWRVYLLGASPGVAEKTAEKLCCSYPGLQIAGTHHGYFREDEAGLVAEAVREAGPDLVFVALGAPRQELWIDRYLESTGAAAAMGVGGSFDVIAGKVRRAPAWVRRLHLEWFSRLLQEPSRWRRQLILPCFACMVLRKYKL